MPAAAQWHDDETQFEVDQKIAGQETKKKQLDEEVRRLEKKRNNLKQKIGLLEHQMERSRQILKDTDASLAAESREKKTGGQKKGWQQKITSLFGKKKKEKRERLNEELKTKREKIKNEGYQTGEAEELSTEDLRRQIKEKRDLEAKKRQEHTFVRQRQQKEKDMRERLKKELKGIRKKLKQKKKERAAPQPQNNFDTREWR